MFFLVTFYTKFFADISYKLLALFTDNILYQIVYKDFKN